MAQRFGREKFPQNKFIIQIHQNQKRSTDGSKVSE
jgi:hypothetical protein